MSQLEEHLGSDFHSSSLLSGYFAFFVRVTVWPSQVFDVYPSQWNRWVEGKTLFKDFIYVRDHFTFFLFFFFLFSLPLIPIHHHLQSFWVFVFYGWISRILLHGFSTLPHGTSGLFSWPINGLGNSAFTQRSELFQERKNSEIKVSTS